jgi:hypothetical protein
MFLLLLLLLLLLVVVGVVLALVGPVAFLSPATLNAILDKKLRASFSSEPTKLARRRPY